MHNKEQEDYLYWQMFAHRTPEINAEYGEAELRFLHRYSKQGWRKWLSWILKKLHI